MLARVARNLAANDAAFSHPRYDDAAGAVKDHFQSRSKMFIDTGNQFQYGIRLDLESFFCAFKHGITPYAQWHQWL